MQAQAQVLEGGARALRVEARGEREIVMTRRFAAPRDLVWEALSRPEHLRRWWGAGGGAGSRMTVCEVDFRVGGAWRFVTSGPRGEHGFGGEFHLIEPPSRLVQTFVWDGAPGHVSVETMTLDERGGVTTMTIACAFASPSDRDAMLATDMEAGAGASYDALEALLRDLGAAAA